jgi:hypothetical protein
MESGRAGNSDEVWRPPQPVSRHSESEGDALTAFGGRHAHAANTFDEMPVNRGTPRSRWSSKSMDSGADTSGESLIHCTRVPCCSLAELDGCAAGGSCMQVRGSTECRTRDPDWRLIRVKLSGRTFSQTSWGSCVAFSRASQTAPAVGVPPLVCWSARSRPAPTGATNVKVLKLVCYVLEIPLNYGP